MGRFRIALLLLLPLVSVGQRDTATMPTTQYKNTLPKPGVARHPYLQMATPGSMLVRWRTDALSRSRVRYGVRPEALDRAADDSALTTEHRVQLTGLQPSTKYYYSVGSLHDTLEGDAGNYFTTLPVPGKEGDYRIGVFGDCGTNSVLQRNVRDQFLRYLGDKPLDAWILLGDNAYENGTDAQFQPNFFNVYKNDLLKHFPLFPAPGNHDYGNVDFRVSAAPDRMFELAYYQNFSLPTEGQSGGVASHNPAYYSFDVGNVHFLSLDSYGREDNAYRLYDTSGPQVQWVKKDLEANRNKGWVVAYWHHPPYSMGSHNSDEQAELVNIRKNFLRILERYGVDLVLCGHSHDYERSRLLKGYYGMEADFDPARYEISHSSGAYDGSSNSCPYVKEGTEGVVYVVSGSAGKLDERSQASFPHAAMPFSDNKNGGAVMLEVQGNRLDLRWICGDGVVRDKFTMMKNVPKRTVVHARKGDTVELTAAFAGIYKWSYLNKDSRSIRVAARGGRAVYTVQDTQGCLKQTFEIVTDLRTAGVLRPVVTTEQTAWDTDDPAIWINRAHPEQSLIVGTDKHSDGGLYVFDLSGRIIADKTILHLKRPNNVDIAYGIRLGGRDIDVAVVTERETNSLRIFSLPDMKPLDKGGIPVFVHEQKAAPMGIGLYTRPSDKALFAIVSRKSGPLENYLWEYRLMDDGSGGLKAEVVRKFGRYSGRKEIESVAVDNELGYVYYSDERYGVHKYYADPEKGNEELTLFGMGDFKEDIEGISIYKTAGGRGYILVSNQQANQFMVYPREGMPGHPHEHGLIKALDFQTHGSDGSDVTNVNLGKKYPKGLFVAMSEKKVFEYFDWRDIEKAIKAN